jgi:hypothetical protein
LLRATGDRLLTTMWGSIAPRSGGALMSEQQQSFENHARTIPAYHFFTFGLIVLNLIWAIYRVVTDFSADRAATLAVAIVLVMVALYARIFALTVQDRVIRLEMRLRLAQLLPVDLQPGVNELSVDQLCALRFASDSELAELTRRVLSDGIKDRKTIKRMIRTWQPDFLRA